VARVVPRGDDDVLVLGQHPAGRIDEQRAERMVAVLPREPRQLDRPPQVPHVPLVHVSLLGTWFHDSTSVLTTLPEHPLG